MSKTKLFTPLNLIVAGLLVIVIYQFGIFGTTFAAINLIDPQTNVTFSCNSTYQCYEKVGGQISGADKGPALICSNSKCVTQECNEGEEVTKSCTTGEKIVVSVCSDGKLEYPETQCPVPECTSDKNCVGTADMDCDGEIDPVFGQCVSHKCQYTSAPRCSNGTIFWNQYKWYIISGGLILLGIGGFILGTKIEHQSSRLLVPPYIKARNN